MYRLTPNFQLLPLPINSKGQSKNSRGDRTHLTLFIKVTSSFQLASVSMKVYIFHIS